MRLLLIRHGETPSNTGHLLDTGHPGAPLNERGLAQAATLVETLAQEPVQAIWTSDLTRARQTGEPLAEALGLSVTTSPRLREIFAGEYDMSPDWVSYVETLASWAVDPTVSLPGGEDAVSFMARFDAGVAEVAASGVDCAAIVSHGAALRIWVPARASNLRWEEVQHWRLDNTDLIVLDGSPADGWKVLTWADNVIGD